MAQASEKMPLAVARRIAVALTERITPFCHEVHIAGSVRREKPDVSDIEVVVVPKWIDEPDPTDLLGERTFPVNLLYRDWASKAEDNGKLWWIKPGMPGIQRGTIKPDGKYWKAHLHNVKMGGALVSFNLDLFLATPDNVGLILLIRTGSAEFSEEVVTYGKRVRRPSFEGYLRKGDAGKDAPIIATPTEADVFRTLNLRWVEPRDRHGKADVVSGWDESRFLYGSEEEAKEDL